VLRDAYIGGHLICTRARFKNAKGEALFANRLTVDASMFLERVRCTGRVRRWALTSADR
jgi:hypothetical protein